MTKGFWNLLKVPSISNLKTKYVMSHFWGITTLDERPALGVLGLGAKVCCGDKRDLPIRHCKI